MVAPPSLTVVVNRSGGTASSLGDKLEPQLREAFASAGAEIDLHLVDGCDILKTVDAAGSETVAVGGGDGTISCAASVLAGSGRRLAVLPLGTLNHFAQAIGLDGSLEQAAQVAVHGTAHDVDLGCAGDRVFVNNASLGIYPRMVRDRDRLPLPKWLATIPAAARVLWRPGARRLPLLLDGRRQRVHTPLLFIGNNRYSLEAGLVGQRESLEDGILSLYAVAPRGGLGLLVGAVRILRGKARQDEDFAALAEVREVTIDRRGRHPVAFDGEVVSMHFPLTFSTKPKALTVMQPAMPQ
jgi:diacylglycerol kinase family enzyme